MPKTTRLDDAKVDKRKAAMEALKSRGKASSEKSVVALAARLELAEKILGWCIGE